MSRNQRIGLIVAAVVFAAVAFVIASPDDDGGGEQAAQTTPATGTEPQAETGPEPVEQPHETLPPAEPEVTRIEIRGCEVAGGPADITATKGDVVRIVVSADAPDDIHLHGYDIEEKAAPGQPARFKFKADVEGIFEIESHVAEDAGKDPLIGKLTVEPG